MGKTGTLNLRVDDKIKNEADAILKRLGIPMSTAIDMFLNQIILSRGLPFKVVLPEAPQHLNIDEMTEEEFREKIFYRFERAQAGHTQELKKF